MKRASFICFWMAIFSSLGCSGADFLGGDSKSGSSKSQGAKSGVDADSDVDEKNGTAKGGSGEGGEDADADADAEGTDANSGAKAGGDGEADKDADGDGAEGGVDADTDENGEGGGLEIDPAVVCKPDTKGGIISFESIPGSSPSEGLGIGDQFKESHGVTFALEPGGQPKLARVGNPKTAYNCTTCSGDGSDAVQSGENYGSYFLTDDGQSGLAGIPLIVTYVKPVAATSFSILDPDGEEQWTVEIFDRDGKSLDKTVRDFPGNAFDGKGVVISFERQKAEISRIRVSGTKATNEFGLAFDHFSPAGNCPKP